MARQLISILEGDFDPSEFRDEYNDRVLDFLNAKAKGRRPKLARLTSKRETKSLEQDLAKSVEAARKAHGSEKRGKRTKEAA